MNRNEWISCLVLSFEESNGGEVSKWKEISLSCVWFEENYLVNWLLKLRKGNNEINLHLSEKN